MTDDGPVLDGEPLPMWLGHPEEVWEHRKKLIGKLFKEGAFAFSGYGKSILVNAKFLHAFTSLPGEGGEDG